MKRILSFCLCLLLCLSLVPAALAAEADSASGVAISKKNFPDAVFRAYVSDFFDADDDGRLSRSELKEATEVDLSRQGVSSLKGIEKLSSLYSLDCSWNDLTELDLSGNPALGLLCCAHNDLTELDVSGSAGLTWLDCSYNQLTALDVRQNTALVVLNCGYNELKTLDVRPLSGLKALDCWSNRLTKLNLRSNPLLISLDCSWNRLTKLNLSKNPDLAEFCCYENRLTALDLSHNPGLKTFWCYNNQLTELDLSRNTALTELNCGGNQLTALDVGRHTGLQLLWVWGNSLRTIDLSHNAALVGFYCESNLLTRLDLSCCPALVELRCFQNQLKKVYVHPDAPLRSAETDEGVKIVRAAPAKPSITAQPKDVTAAAGQAVTFKVKASGKGLSYQWQYRVGENGSWKNCTTEGCTTAALTVEAAARRDGYQYRCKVTNSAGTVRSEAATLRVKPAITAQPQDLTAAKGETVSFTVKASGPNLSYQWQYRTSATGKWKDCTTEGCRTATLKVEATAKRNGYQYRCKVTNSAGTVKTVAATLTVK